MSRYSILTTVFLFCLCCSIVSLSHSLNNGFTVELIHRDSSKSPFYNPTETKFQRLANAIHRSINFANYFNKVSQTVQTPKTTVIPDRSDYLMEYSVGTPPFKIFGIVDTGSDIVWLQCKPCEDCYNQTSPIFDPSKSSTYKTLPCNSSTCKSVENTECNINNCEYNIQYGGGAVSQGDLSVDTLSLDSTNGLRISFPKTVLGCGHKNIGTFHSHGSGIVGLGGGPVSFTTQLSSQIGGKFSYCLVPLFSDANATSSLNFGDSALVSGKGAVSTPFVQPQGSIFYILTLEGFSVENEKIEFGSNGGFSQGNIIIDSGTTLTLLPHDLYSRLEASVAKVVKLERAEDPSKQLNLCYKIYSQADLRVPVITAHFSGADVVLNSLNTFIPVEEGIVCFAFGIGPFGIGAIFGNVAQQNLLVGYDLQKKVVSFKPTDCTKQY